MKHFLKLGVVERFGLEDGSWRIRRTLAILLRLVDLARYFDITFEATMRNTK
jgi:hypothetical protein